MSILDYLRKHAEERAAFKDAILHTHWALTHNGPLDRERVGILLAHAQQRERELEAAGIAMKAHMKSVEERYRR